MNVKRKCKYCNVEVEYCKNLGVSIGKNYPIIEVICDNVECLIKYDKKYYIGYVKPEPINFEDEKIKEIQQLHLFE